MIEVAAAGVSGRVLAVGAGVASVKPGQRIAWIYAPGSYAERIAMRMHWCPRLMTSTTAPLGPSSCRA